VLAKRYGITEQTIYKWKHRQDFMDGSYPAPFADHAHAGTGKHCGVFATHVAVAAG